MDERRRLLALLAEAQEIGLIGSRPVENHLDHALGWAEVLGDPPPALFLDLGSGGGLPGLPFALAWPGAAATLLDSRRRSVTWIASAVEQLGWESRVSVVEDRAERGARSADLREAFPLVVARGFGAPSETAECGSAFVAVGGRLSVSEPPGGDPARWPEQGLATLGLALVETRVVGEGSFVILSKLSELDDRYPRRVGKPHQRPLW